VRKLPEGSLKESQQRIGVELKTISQQVESAKVFLADGENNALENALMKWNDGLTGEGYPIQQKAQAFKPHDHIIKRVLDAQQAF
jgi:hypothetical protein